MMEREKNMESEVIGQLRLKLESDLMDPTKVNTNRRGDFY